MKNHLIILITLVFLQPCFSQKNLLPVYPNEISYSNNRAYFKGTPFTGLLVTEKTNKKMGEFKEGFKTGLFLEYFPNGKKKMEIDYVDGVKNGVETEWFVNGQKKVSFIYSNGSIVDGKYTIYDEKGLKASEITYLDNNIIKNGIYVEYYPNGNKKIENSFINGVKDGIETQWYENGQKKSSFEYSSDRVKNGVYITYFENGKSEFEETFLDKEVTKKISYNLDGQYESKEEYITEYYSNGTSVKSKGIRINDLKEGLWLEYHENGQKSKESTFIKDIENGAVTVWHKNGRIAAVGAKESGKDNGLWEMWDENGKKILEVNFLNGKPDGVMFLFLDGVKKFKAIFENGVQINIIAIDN